jgi:arsenite methyltransferase
MVLAYPADGLRHLAKRIDDIYRNIQPPSDPMLDFDERDLIKLAEQVGFFPIELELRAEIRPIEPYPWDVSLNTAGNPKVPTFGEAMAQALTPQERQQVTEHLRPLVEEGRGVRRMAYADLIAVKPSA